MCIEHSDFKEYNKVDGALAIAVFILIELNTYFTLLSSIGKLVGKELGYTIYNFLLNVLAYQPASKWANLISSIPFNCIPVISIITILLIRKQKFSSLGFQKHHNLRALLIGIGGGILTALFMYSVLFFCGKPNVFRSLQKLSFSVPVLLSNIVLTGLTEELCYRSYIQTRITGLIKNQWVAIIVVGLMFWVAHFINDFLNGPVSITDLLVQGIDMVCAHILYLFLYRKTGNILTAIFCHGIYDFMISPIYF